MHCSDMIKQFDKLGFNGEINPSVAYGDSSLYTREPELVS